MTDDERWLEVAARILDGAPVAWDTLPAEVATASGCSTDDLRLLADIATAHRAAAAPESDRWGPLRMLESIGGGAFGDVYRAHDPALDREVALKILKHSARDVTEEGRLLARVRHPNVVTVHGAAEHDGRHGIWMEFVRGRTLADVVARDGRLAPGEVVTIGLDVCRALAAVHGAGLLHGDVKPQNVMREPDGRIVLMDFGTGRLVADDSGAPALAGTPLYLAPEVLAGQPPDARADVYAVGVLLYYLLTAAAPVEGRTLTDVRAAHTGGRRVRVRDRRPDVPRPLATIIDRATSPDPAERFESAVALEAALARATPASAGSRFRRFAAAAALLLAGAAGFGWWQWSGASRTAAAPRWVLVGAFDNRTGDPRLDDVVQFAFEQELAQSHAVSVVTRERVADTLALMKRPPDTRVDATLAREVCLRDGEIPFFAVGRVDRVGSRYALNVSVTDARTGRSIARAGVDVPELDGLLSSVKGLAATVRQSVGDDRKQIETDARLEKVTTGSLDALRAYTTGVDLINERRWAAAEVPLRDAVRLDPHFGSAHIMLAYSVRNQIRPTADFLPAAQRAFELSGALPERERYFIVGSYYGMTGDIARAAAAYEVLVRAYPNDYWGTNNLATMYAQLGRQKEAAAVAAKLAALRPNDLATNTQAAEAAVLEGDLAGARSLVARAAALNGGSNRPAPMVFVAWVELFPVFEQWANGRVAEAAALLDATTARARMSGRFAQHVGLMNLAMGRLRKADEAFHAMSDSDEPFEFFSLVALARGDLNGARSALLADPRLADVIHHVPPGPSAMDAWLLARFGLVDEADALVKAWEFPGDTRIGVLGARAEVLAARGEHDAAIPMLARIQEQPATAFRLRELESLADVLIGRGDFQSATTWLRKSDGLRQTLYPLGGSSGYFWLRVRTRLLDVERRLGRTDRAAEIEQELRHSLAEADPDFALLRDLH